jgi:hypothetical protein
MKRRMKIMPLKTLRICVLLFPVRLNAKSDAIPVLAVPCFHGMDRVTVSLSIGVTWGRGQGGANTPPPPNIFPT